MKTDELIQEIDKYYNKCPYSLRGYLIGMLKTFEIESKKNESVIQFHINSFKKESK